MDFSAEDLAEFSKDELTALIYSWDLWARSSQLPPDHPNSSNHPPNEPNPDWDYWIALAGRGFGKALALDTLIPTPSGLTPLANIQTGDLVYAPDGTATRVLMAHPPLLNRPCYRLTFDNGQSVVADEEHLWATIPREQRRRPKERYKGIYTTAEIRDSVRVGSTANHFIPSTLPLQSPHLPLPVDPYLLGYWLGDGSSKQWSFTILKEDLPHFESKLPLGIITQVKQDKSPSCWDVKLSNGKPLSRSQLTGQYESNDSLVSQLKYLSLYKNKHIPLQYLLASVEHRIELLRGLMDSDGSVNKLGNQASFYSTNPRLADDVYYLMSSLGYVVSRSIKQPKITGKPEAICQPCHILRIRPRRELNPFSLPRKRDRVAPLASTQSSRLGGRFITSVTPVPSVPVRCLTVEHQSKLYLVTPDCIPTHNTRLGAEQVLRWVDQGYRRIAIIAPTTADTRDVVTEGESGILSVAHPLKRPTYEPSKRRLTFPNGAIATLYSAEEPERLRGPQFDAAWLDEIAGWQYPQEVWDMLHFGLRLGRHPQVVVSTTPKPIPLIRSLIDRAKKDPKRYVLTTGSTYDNKANLARTFFSQVAQYEGTRLGQQELYAELIDPRENGIIKSTWLNLWPKGLPLPKFELIVQSYDTAFTEQTLDRKTRDPDPSACSTWGVFELTPRLRELLGPYMRVTPAKWQRYAVLLLDAWTEHLGYPELRQKVKTEYNNSWYGPDGDERRADVVLIENKGSGISLRQDLQLTVPVREYNPGRADKVQRLHAVSNIPCLGLVFIPASSSDPDSDQDKPFARWADPLVDQVCSFPMVEHDDLVDTKSQALQYIKDSGYLTCDEPEEVEDYADDSAPRRRNPYAS